MHAMRQGMLNNTGGDTSDHSTADAFHELSAAFFCGIAAAPTKQVDH
jgi:hypothetical protein